MILPRLDIAQTSRHTGRLLADFLEFNDRYLKTGKLEELNELSYFLTMKILMQHLLHLLSKVSGTADARFKKGFRKQYSEACN